MSDQSTSGTDRWIACVCGRTEIEHSHGNLWKCEACGRFHDPGQLDRLADESRALQADTDRDNDLVTDGGRERDARGFEIPEKPGGPISGLFWEYDRRRLAVETHAAHEGHEVNVRAALESYSRTMHPRLYRVRNLVGRVRSHLQSVCEWLSIFENSTGRGGGST